MHTGINRSTNELLEVAEVIDVNICQVKSDLVSITPQHLLLWSTVYTYMYNSDSHHVILYL